MILRTALMLGALLAASAAQAERSCNVPGCESFRYGSAGCGYCQGCEAAGGDANVEPADGGYRVDCAAGAQAGKVVDFTATGAPVSGRPLTGKAIGAAIPATRALR